MVVPGGKVVSNERCTPVWFYSEGWWQSSHSRCRAKVAHTRQSKPDSSLDINLKVLETFKVVGGGRTYRVAGLIAMSRALGNPETPPLKPLTLNPQF